MNITVLPREIIFQVFEYITAPKDVVSLLKTSQTMATLVYDLIRTLYGVINAAELPGKFTGLRWIRGRVTGAKPFTHLPEVSVVGVIDCWNELAHIQARSASALLRQDVSFLGRVRFHMSAKRIKGRLCDIAKNCEPQVWQELFTRWKNIPLCKISLVSLAAICCLDPPYPGTVIIHQDDRYLGPTIFKQPKKNCAKIMIRGDEIHTLSGGVVPGLVYDMSKGVQIRHFKGHFRDGIGELRLNYIIWERRVDMKSPYYPELDGGPVTDFVVSHRITKLTEYIDLENIYMVKTYLFPNLKEFNVLCHPESAVKQLYNYRPFLDGFERIHVHIAHPSKELTREIEGIDSRVSVLEK